jgi:zinc protease
MPYRSLTVAALLLTAALFSIPAAAADKPSKIFPFSYDQHDYPNGLRLITVPTDYPNVVSLYIVVQVGSRNEVEPGKSGFAHFFEHMMFRGTKQYPPEKREAIMKDAGAAQNAYTSDDLTAYHATFSKEDLDTILKVEADRFQNLEYTEADFKTEALAVLGEYNKNSSAPAPKINEVMRNTAFDKHTYKHTTMGFLEDIKDMPNEFEYSKQFFDRYYRPEYTTVLIVGDVDPKQTRAMVEKYWGGWKRGSYKAAVPVEPPQKTARTANIDWPSQTLPWVTIAFKGPAYTDTEKDSAALDVLSFLAFGENSDLYQRLVIQEQKTDILSASNPDHADPFLFAVYSRVKKAEHTKNVEEQILSTIAGFKDNLVPAEKLESVKRRLRYEFALGMNNSEAIASTLAHYIALRRTPETVNRIYDLYAAITPEDVRNAARKYLVENGRTTVTLSGPKQ